MLEALLVFLIRTLAFLLPLLLLVVVVIVDCCIVLWRQDVGQFGRQVAVQIRREAQQRILEARYSMCCRTQQPAAFGGEHLGTWYTLCTQRSHEPHTL